MESVYHIKTHKYFDVSHDDFQTFQDIFSSSEPRNEEDALSEVNIAEETFSRPYTEDEIKSIFWLDAEYSGLDKEFAKDKVIDISERYKVKEELENYIKSSKKDRKPLSLKSAKALLKVFESFESMSCEIND